MGRARTDGARASRRRVAVGGDGKPEGDGTYPSCRRLWMTMGRGGDTEEEGEEEGEGITRITATATCSSDYAMRVA
jgi:hypothetical protein